MFKKSWICHLGVIGVRIGVVWDGFWGSPYFGHCHTEVVTLVRGPCEKDSSTSAETPGVAGLGEGQANFWLASPNPIVVSMFFSIIPFFPANQGKVS